MNWKLVDGYEDYSVSDTGLIMSNKTGNLMGITTGADGYQHISLYGRNRNRKTLKVHRIVATAFVDNPESKPEVNHKNGNRADNRSSNLEWVTRSENIFHSWNTLGRDKSHVAELGRKTWTEEMRKKLSETRKGKWCGGDNPKSKTVIRKEDGMRFTSMVEAGKYMGIDSSSISKACSGEIKTAGGYHWMIEEKENCEC